MPLPPLRDLLDPGTEPASLMSPALAGGFFEAASTAGVDAGLGCGEEGSLVVPSYEIPTPCRPHAFLGNLLGHLRVSGQLLGKHRSHSPGGGPSRTSRIQMMLCLLLATCLWEARGSQRLGVLFCAMGTIKPANLTVRAVPEDEFFNPWRVSKV